MEEDMKKGLVYYTDNVPPKKFLKTIRTHLKRVSNGISIVWVSQRPIDEENNIVLRGLSRSHHSRCLQILTGVKKLDVDVIYFAEHDVIYHPSHFDFLPKDKDVFYYNLNRWWLRSSDGKTCFREAQSLSQLVAYKGIIEDFYIRRMAYYADGIKIGCGNEPGKHVIPELPPYKNGSFYSKWPNIDIRHSHNYTRSNKFKAEYELRDEIPFWGKTKDRYEEFIKGLDGTIFDTN